MSRKILYLAFALLLAASAPGPCAEAAPLEGTEPLTMTGDLAAHMVAGLRQFLLRQIEASRAGRAAFWRCDFSSPEAYVRSIAPNRERFRACIGAVDERAAPELSAVSALGASTLETERYRIHTVRWTVLDGVDAEGLLLEPREPPVAHVIALPDCDTSPEELAGVGSARAPEAQFARRLAENGCRVLVPVLVDRADTWSGNPRIGRMTNLSHREWVYRQAFELGRHIIGYEVEKVMAAVDWFLAHEKRADLPIGVIGYGEGGLVALAAAAIDPRIDAACVSGYFCEREEVWKEPIYRNVWGLLREFGDAGAACLIAPRHLIVEASEGPSVANPVERQGRRGAAPGEIVSPPFEKTKAEFDRVAAVYAKLGVPGNAVLIGAGTGPAGRDEALAAFLRALGSTAPLAPSQKSSAGLPRAAPATRLTRQLDELVAYTQRLMRLSEHRRAELFSKIDHSSLEAYRKSCEPYRALLRSELIGEVEPPSAPPRPRSRPYGDDPAFRGYEVVLQVWPEAFAYGILLVPRDLAPGERRPVVVCQHGLEGRPQDVVDRKPENPYYHAFAARLADRGYVVFAPQNPYIGGDNFRVLQRMAQPLKATLFSLIVRQHERITEWLAALPFVDPSRIAFYGLSYGGKTAMRVPALVDRYCLSICSADFNEWVVKNVTIDSPMSYMFTGEYDMAEFNLGHTASYAEMAALIAPRPFMVERGHWDGVAPDEWVAYEYAKVRRRYDQLGIGERTEIEFFDGPHEIHGVGTFAFLARHLGWR